jgi:prolipoprotein diacylglyceryltransferase
MIPVGSHAAWHPVFEVLGYVSAYAAYRRARKREGDALADAERWSVIAAAALGALVGCRVLGVAEQWPAVLAASRSGQLMALVLAHGGKTIVGGLLGGWIGVMGCRFWRWHWASSRADLRDSFSRTAGLVAEPELESGGRCAVPDFYGELSGVACGD